MDAALEIHEYLPLTYPSASEGDYVRFLWESFESNYMNGKYQFAMLAFHMLYMSHVYFSVWQIKNEKESDFQHALTFLEERRRRQLLEASSPFTFHVINESGIFGFLRIIGCQDEQLVRFKRLVRLRNESAHPNGVIALPDQAAADSRIEEVMRQIQDIQTHRSSILQGCLLQFLRDSANSDEREIADREVHIEINLLHRNYLSRKDIATCLSVDVAEFDRSPFKEEVTALMDVLRSRSEE
ncbi:hypothetical protein [Stenotrophomonas sp. GZD-301]|uniref:hypothetical protein n=1 Tax=Stenotrophomonas sp. GZD-301 TaxID=3404814 RepID=UPI003BB72E61